MQSRNVIPSWCRPGRRQLRPISELAVAQAVVKAPQTRVVQTNRKKATVHVDQLSSFTSERYHIPQRPQVWLAHLALVESVHPEECSCAQFIRNALELRAQHIDRNSCNHGAHVVMIRFV